MSRVVGIGLVQLEHRELGVPAIAEALVAEHPADLEHLLEAAGDQPLEVELGRDAQVHVHVERVVVGDERLRVRAAGQRMQDRRLDFDEPAVFEPAAHERHEPAAQLERLADVVAHPQVDVTLAVPGVGVGDAVPLVGERPRRFGEQHPLVDPHRELAALRRHHDRRAHRSSRRATARRSRRSPASPAAVANSWMRPVRVLQRAEGELALHPPQHQPTGDGRDSIGLGAAARGASNSS